MEKRRKGGRVIDRWRECWLAIQRETELESVSQNESQRWRGSERRGGGGGGEEVERT